MNNKILFLLPFFLILPTATQCMEKEIVCTPKTMQEIRDERDFIHNQSYSHKDPIRYALSQYSLSTLLEYLKQLQDTAAKLKFTYNISENKQLPNCQKYTLRGYSFLGIATTVVGEQEALMIESKKVLSKKHVSFTDKKKYISQLLALDFKTTDKDKYFALLTKYEEFGPSIIKKKLLLQNPLFFSEIELPQDIIDCITLLMFETEESLL